jgi:HK97 gp10 family phage protein
MIVRTQGYQNLLRELEGFTDLLEEAGDSGIKALAVQAARIARQGAPKESGKLKKSIRAGHVRPFKGMGKGQKKLKGIGYFGSDLSYAHLVEFGTAPHSVRKGSRMRKKKIDTEVGETTGQHPGAKATPYIRPALDAIQTQAPGILREVIRKRLARK